MQKETVIKEDGVLKKKQDIFKEDYLDDTLKNSVDFKDPLDDNLDIKDPLNTDFELDTTDSMDIEEVDNSTTSIDKPVKKKGLFSKGKKKRKNEVVEETDINLDKIDVEEYYDDSLSIEELEQRERIRQRQELAKAEMEKKKADRKAFIESFKTVGTIGWFVFFSILSTGYMWWLCGLLIPSILIGMIGGTRLTYWFYFRNNVLKQEEEEFKSLTNIATQINFNMQNGKNVADTLEFIKDDYDGRIGADLNYTYSKLMVEGELITENFEKYGFTSFDIFLRNLQIAYHDGIDSKQLFKFPLSNINYEAIERDNLARKNRASRKQEMFTMGIAVFIPFSLRLFAKEVFMAYLGYPLPAFILATIVYFAFVFIATHLQKVALDVSVSI